MASDVNVHLDYPVATVLLNRPQKLNALSMELVADLEAATERVASDPAVRVVIVRGEGGSFCAGLDLDMFAAEGMPAGFYQSQERSFRLLETMDKISVAAIHGHCVGGGVQLAAACDLRVASSNARFSLPAVNEGLFPGMAPYRLPRLVGRGRALSLILSGETMSATEAYAIGLVDRCAGDEDFGAEVNRLISALLAAPRAAAIASKRLLARSYEAGFEEVLLESEELLQACLTSPEVKAAREQWLARATHR